MLLSTKFEKKLHRFIVVWCIIIPKEATMPPEIKYEILKKVGVISETKSGWKKELNVIKWTGNNRENNPKFDIRDWSPDGKKMGKGITLDKEEATTLIKLLSEATL
jgi:hypothetical protein